MENNFKKNKAKVKTCGKLYIGGEYSILTPYQSAIIKNINIFMYANIQFSKDKYKIYSSMFNYFTTLKYDKNYSLIQETIKITNEFLQKKYNAKLRPFKLEIVGKMEKNGKKYGIGSSGSVVILTIKAMFKLYKINISKDMIFKLASYILLKMEDNGSMGDIACISYESLILYKSFNRKEISEIINTKDIVDILNMDWGYKIEEIKTKNIEFLVGWTKEPAISKDMINKVKSSIDENFLNNTEKSVINLKNDLINNNKKNIKKEIETISNLLKGLNNSIYNNKLLKLVEATNNLDICAKSSGAGGGDCGIALSFNKNDTKKIIFRWKKENINLLYIDKL